MALTVERMTAKSALTRPVVGAGRAVAVLMWLSVAAFGLACVLGPHHGFLVWRDGVLSWSTQALPALYCWISLAQGDVRARRLERTLMATAVSAFACGDAVLLWLLSHADRPPVPSAADFGYLGFYPLAASAVVVAAHRQGLLRRRVAWFDMATGALAGATVVAVGLGPEFHLPGGGTLAAVITGFFPTFDACFLALIVAVAAAQAFRVPRSWAVLLLGFAVFTAADIAFARLLAADSYTVGTPLDATWSVGLALMASWCTARPPRVAPRGHEPADLVVSVVSVLLGCLVLLAAAVGADLPPAALVLAATTVLSTTLKAASSRAAGLERVHDLTLQRSRLLDRLVAAQEEERARLANDVHDEPVQALAAVSLRLGLLKRRMAQQAPELVGDVEQLEGITEEVLGGLRAVLADLEPVHESQDLVGTLRDTLATLFDGTATSYRLDAEGLPPLQSAELTKAIRIAREALRNVDQHARAEHVVVSVRAVDGGVEVSVEDDGVGVSPQTWSSPPGHRGLTTMRDRASLAGGWLRLEAAPGGRGTVVRFWLPTPALATADLPPIERPTTGLPATSVARA